MFGFEGTNMYSNGPVAQLVRASPCHGEGRRFESDLGRYNHYSGCATIEWGLS